MPERENFTKASIAKLLERHDGTRRTIHDAKQPGLIIDVRETGAASFYLYKKIGGRPSRIRLGAVGEMTVEQARNQAAKLIGQVADGRNVVAERRTARVEHTLGALFDWWNENHNKVHRKRWKEPERLYKKHLAAWKTRRLSTIGKQDVQALHAKLGKENGRTLANRVVELLKALFNKAEDIGFRGQNPAQRITKYAEQSRDRFLQPDEVPKFVQSLELEPALFSDFFWLLLLTGARKGNLQSLRWNDLDLQARTWRVSGEQSKNGAPLIINLPAKAVEILLLRYHDKKDSPYVFASHGKTGHLVEVKTAWNRIIDRAGLKDIRPHDLRRTLGSWLAIQGVSLTVIGAALGHKSLQSTAVYARLTQQPVIDAVSTATTALIAAGEVKPTKHRKGASRGKKAK